MAAHLMASDHSPQRISSRQNPFIKSLKAWARDAGRDGGPVWLEGVHLCQEYLQRVGLPARAVFEAPRHETGELRALWRACAGAERVLLDAGLLGAVSEVAGAQGVGFLIEPPRLDAAVRIDTDCVVLDRLQDPGNVGSILRSCAAAGVGTVLLTRGSAAVWSGKVLRAGQGAHFALRLVEGLAPDEVLARLDVPLLATALQGGEALYDASLPAAAAWCFGHEGQGVHASLLAGAAQRVYIPQASGVESLNVAAAAAVCLFEHRRRRMAGQAR